MSARGKKKARRKVSSPEEKQRDFKDAADFILGFSDNDLPSLLSGVELPSVEFTPSWKDTNALFASLFQRANWKAVQIGTSDFESSWPPFPMRFLEENDEDRFLSALADNIEQYIAEHHETILAGTSESEIPGFCSTRSLAGCGKTQFAGKDLRFRGDFCPKAQQNFASA